YDVSLAPRLGKKGRPEHLFQLLIAPNAREEVAEASFSQTSTIGLRWRVERRLILQRTADEVSVEGLSVRRKTVERPGVGRTTKAESDDLSQLSTLAHRRATRVKAEGEG
ncbi:MAG: nickel insertion protein, partial [Pseudomonadota bacterium]